MGEHWECLYDERLGRRVSNMLKGQMKGIEGKQMQQKNKLKRKILVTGLFTLHWGRLEYGNVGNYYIVEPLFRALTEQLKDWEILTTFQMTDEFIYRDKIEILPMDMYYAWKEDDVKRAAEEYHAALKYGVNVPEELKTEYMKIIDSVELVINVAGDMWGDNAEHVGHNRFLVDLYKMRTAQLLGTKTVLYAVTPGPFSSLDSETERLAKEVFANFDLVENREPTSTDNLKEWGFESGKVRDFACPAFLYKPTLSEQERICLKEENPFLYENGKEKVCGFTFGGFNLPVGPYDMWPREDEQYTVFVEAIEHIINDLGMRVLLFSHTNGFRLPPDFELINGRDFCILEQLYKIIVKRERVPKDKIYLIDKPYVPAKIKTVIGKLDMLVTGRVHASVAGISQYVPTVFINYEKSFIPSTKMSGFASLAGVGEFVCDPRDKQGLIDKIDKCASNLEEISDLLHITVSEVKKRAKNGLDELLKV